MKQVVPLQATENDSGANTHSEAFGGSHTGTGGYTMREAVAHGAHAGAGAPGPGEELTQVFCQEQLVGGTTCWSRRRS